MTQYFPKVRPGEMKQEFAGAELGDARLHERLGEIVEALAKSPESSFAGMCDTEAEREGLYRFLRNRRVEWKALLEPHVEETVTRARRARRVLVVHDTTEMQLCEQAELRSYLRAKKKGFLAHISLVLDANEERRPLGIAALDTIERKTVSKLRKNGRPMRGNETTKLANREFERWGRGVDETSKLLTDVDELIHVMDAESDSYELLASMHEAGHRFVTRLAHDRRAKAVHPDADIVHIRRLLTDAKTFKRTREVHVSKRAGKRAPDAAKARPARHARTAELAFSFRQVIIQRPWYLKTGPKELRLQVVRVVEKSPPAGVTPIEWVLLTNLPVETKVSVERIVDIYRQRWLVEEFFRALKTGCAFRKRKLSNRQSIYNSLALLTPVAWRALFLRQTARNTSASSAKVFSQLELCVMKAKAKSLGTKLPAQPSAAEALAFLAQIGGHRKSNGPPGWVKLIRGLQRLDDLVAGWSLREALEI